MYLCVMPQFSPLKSPTLEVVPWLVLWLCGCEVVFQEGLDVFEGRSLIWLLLPAMSHHLVEGLGAALWAGHAVASFYLLKYLSIHHTWQKQKGIQWLNTKVPILKGPKSYVKKLKKADFMGRMLPCFSLVHIIIISFVRF